MRKIRFHHLHTCLRTFVVLTICSSAMSLFAQSVTWQFLPWPDNSGWPGPQGQPATTNGNQIALTGHDVLSVQSYAGPVTISYDLFLPSKTTTDGGFHLVFVTPGEPTNLVANPAIDLYMTFSSATSDQMYVFKDQSLTLFGPYPFTVNAQTVYHVSVDVASDGQVSWTVNGQTIPLSNSVVVPYSTFQLRLSSWQPTQIWQVSNFTVTGPAPACPDIIGTWSGPVNVANLFSGYSKTTLSLHVTDQNTNGCLLRGYLNTGNGRGKLPWGCFNPGGMWGNVPFTGTILNTTGLVLNLGIFGQASATLDMTQTPPVMKKFILLSTGGAANGSTAVGT